MVSIVVTVVIVALVTLIVGIQLVRVIVEAVVMGRIVGVHAVAAVVIRRSAHGFAPENVNCTLQGGLSALGNEGKHLVLLYQHRRQESEGGAIPWKSLISV